uniref:Uncharacterized protein n=1 Tax=Arundo donax TaxID=35708 RepID=A0A0A9HTL8_ARUDO
MNTIDDKIVLQYGSNPIFLLQNCLDTLSRFPHELGGPGLGYAVLQGSVTKLGPDRLPFPLLKTFNATMGAQYAGGSNSEVRWMVSTAAEFTHQKLKQHGEWG